MAKCGVCGQELNKRPEVTEKGHCSECNEKLEMQDKGKSK